LARRARPIHAAAGDLIPIPWGEAWPDRSSTSASGEANRWGLSLRRPSGDTEGLRAKCVEDGGAGGCDLVAEVDAGGHGAVGVGPAGRRRAGGQSASSIRAATVLRRTCKVTRRKSRGSAVTYRHREQRPRGGRPVRLLASAHIVRSWSANGQSPPSGSNDMTAAQEPYPQRINADQSPFDNPPAYRPTRQSTTRAVSVAWLEVLH
jgi:hypothetical protein